MCEVHRCGPEKTKVAQMCQIEHSEKHESPSSEIWIKCCEPRNPPFKLFVQLGQTCALTNILSELIFSEKLSSNWNCILQLPVLKLQKTLDALTF